MRDAETTLTIIGERGKKGLPLERVYRLLFNPDLYLRAYGRTYRNDGATTRGSTEDTIDGMSQKRIEDLIEAVRYERHRWVPVRRTYIPKTNGKLRPLGIPTWTDKLLQEVMRSILEAYYEPQFSPHSHGFRPDRGCHTALKEIFIVWKGTKWFIEGDIKGCFDNIDHEVLLSILREKIHDGRFVNLVGDLLKAGYLERWNYRPTLSGTPQGGIISPILSNIYLDRLDKFVEQTLIPEYNRGTIRKDSREYRKIVERLRWATKRGDDEGTLKTLRKSLHKLPSKDHFDPDYRRLRYIRYADDFLLGFAGPKDEAEEIKNRIGDFLRDQLKLEMSPEKTLITHASTSFAKFLGYEIGVSNPRRGYPKRGMTRLRMPLQKLEDKIAQYTKDGRAVHRPELLNDSDYDIVLKYGSEYRGIVQYYAYAENRYWLGKLHWFMRTSLLKTLAAKHKSSVTKMFKAHKAETTDRGRRLMCIEARIQRPGREPMIARFGGLQLKPSPLLRIRDLPMEVDRRHDRTELIQRLLADTCELCGSNENVEVHHIRKLSDLKVPGRREKPTWLKTMAARKRKTLIVCRECHVAIHNGRPTRTPTGQEAADNA